MTRTGSHLCRPWRKVNSVNGIHKFFTTHNRSSYYYGCHISYTDDPLTGACNIRTRIQAKSFDAYVFSKKLMSRIMHAVVTHRLQIQEAVVREPGHERPKIFLSRMIAIHNLEGMMHNIRFSEYRRWNTRWIRKMSIITALMIVSIFLFTCCHCQFQMNRQVCE